MICLVLQYIVCIRQSCTIISPYQLLLSLVHPRCVACLDFVLPQYIEDCLLDHSDLDSKYDGTTPRDQDGVFHPTPLPYYYCQCGQHRIPQRLPAPPLSGHPVVHQVQHKIELYVPIWIPHWKCNLNQQVKRVTVSILCCWSPHFKINPSPSAFTHTPHWTILPLQVKLYPGIMAWILLGSTDSPLFWSPNRGIFDRHRELSVKVRQQLVMTSSSNQSHATTCFRHNINSF